MRPEFRAADLRSALSVLDTALHILGPKCLARRLHFDRGFAADVGETLAENLADLAHGSKLLGLLNTLIAILAADTAAGLFAGLVGVAFAGAFALLILRLLGFVARLAVLRIALLLLAALLAILGGLLLLAAVLLPCCFWPWSAPACCWLPWLPCCGLTFESRFCTASFTLLKRLEFSPELLSCWLPDCA